MIVNVRYINASSSSFVPRETMIPKLDEKIWLTVNRGKKPPTTCELISEESKLGLDGCYIKLKLGDNIEVNKHDILSIEGYDFYVDEQIPL